MTTDDILNTPGARVLRGVFAAAFLTLAVVVRDQPTADWFAPAAWPWITGVTGAVLVWSVWTMSERADTWSAAAIVTTSLLWIAGIVDVAWFAVAQGRSLTVHMIVAVLWTLTASVGAAWPWIMRPSRLRHRAHRRSRA